MEGLHTSRYLFSRSQFPGRDYVNPMLGSDYVGDPLESVRKRHKEPRMPWVNRMQMI
jgi:hypothetical protein